MGQIFKLIRFHSKLTLKKAANILPENRFLRVLVFIILLFIPSLAMVIQYSVYRTVFDKFGLEEMLFVQYSLAGLVCMIISLIMIVSKMVYAKDFNLLVVLPIEKKLLIIGNLVNILIPIIIIEFLIYLPSLVSLKLIGQLTAERALVLFINIIGFSILTFSFVAVIEGILLILFRKSPIISKITAGILCLIILCGIAGILYHVRSFIEEYTDFIANGGIFNMEMLIGRILNRSRSLFVLNQNLCNITLLYKGIAKISAILINAVFAGAAFLLAAEIYTKIAGMGNENLHTAKNKNKLRIRRNSILCALINREFWMIKSEALFFSNTIMEIVLMPALLLFFTIIVKIGMNYSPDIVNAIAVVNQMDISVFLCIGLILAVVNLQSGPLVPVSKEGRYFILSRVLPIPYSYQYISKTIFLLIGTVLSITAAYLVLVIGKVVDIEHPILYYIFMLCSEMLLISHCSSYDYRKPFLDWDEPRKATNGNLNILFGILKVMLDLSLISAYTGLVILLKINIVSGLCTGILLLIFVTFIMAIKKWKGIGTAYRKTNF